MIGVTFTPASTFSISTFYPALIYCTMLGGRLANSIIIAIPLDYL
jgi:hypothetical protein